MTASNTAFPGPERLLPLIGGALSVLVGCMQAYFLYQSFALIIEFGYYDLVYNNLLVMSAQLLSMVMALVGGFAILARMHWGWPLTVGAAGFQLALFTQLAAVYGLGAMAAVIDQAAYVQVVSLALCAAAIVLLSLRPSTRDLSVRAPHVLASLIITATLLLIWNMVQSYLFK